MALLPFNNREGKIFMDGDIIEWNDAQTHILTHGLHYSSCVFEGERAYNGNIFKSHAHSERLLNSAKLIYMEPSIAAADICAAKRAVLDANGFENAYLRAFLWYGGEQMGIDTTKCVTHFAVAAWTDWESYFDPAERAKGIVLATVPTRRPPPECVRVHSKSAGNYQISICAKKEAQMQGAYDALMLDWEGFVTESSGANIFFIKDGVLITPNADRFLNGITRQTVIGLAKDQGITIDDTRRILPEELFAADEIFLTGSAAEITPVRAIQDGDKVHSFEIGDVTKGMIDAYGALVRS